MATIDVKFEAPIELLALYGGGEMEIRRESVADAPWVEAGRCERDPGTGRVVLRRRVCDGRKDLDVL